MASRAPDPEPDRDPAAAPAPKARVEGLAGAERTLLMWVRTGISMMTFGFIIGRFSIFARGLQHSDGAAKNGTAGGVAIVVAGAVVNGIAAVRYVRTYRAILRGDEARPSLAGPTALAIVTSAAGVAVVVFLVMSLLERAG
jgi:putative membrane protein